MHNLRRPLFLAALALLVLNDHVLKGAGLLPTWLTGKLSDVAGLLIAPVLLAACLHLRSRAAWLAAHALVAAVFTSIKLDPRCAQGWDALLSGVGVLGHTTVDPTDLLALPALFWSARTFATSAPAAATSQRFSTGVVAFAALLFCAGSSRYPNLTQSAKAPPHRYRELGSIPIKGNEAMSFVTRQLKAEHTCTDVLANPSILKPDFFETTPNGGLVEEFVQPIENGDTRAIEGRDCGVLLVEASTSGWFGFSQFALPMTYVIWDRRAILTAKLQAKPNTEIGLVELRKGNGRITLESKSPLVKVIPVPAADLPKH